MYWSSERVIIYISSVCVCVCVCVCVQSFGPVQLFATPWTVADQAPPSMEFFRQEYWSGLPFPSPGDLPNPGIKPPTPALAGGFFATSTTLEAPYFFCTFSLLLNVYNKSTEREFLFNLLKDFFLMTQKFAYYFLFLLLKLWAIVSPI